jgi:hypothetical protein
MGGNIEEEPVFAGIGQVVLKGPAEPHFLVKIRVIDIEIPADTLEAFKKGENGRAFGFLLRCPPEPFDYKESGA